ARRRAMADRIARGTGLAERLIVEPRLDEPWTVLPGVDLALILGDDTTDPAAGESTPAGSGLRLLRDLWSTHAPQHLNAMPGVTPMLWPAAAGKIIVAEASYAVSEIVEHQHSALLAKPRDDRALVRRIHRAVEDRQLAWAVADAARSEAYS